MRLSPQLRLEVDIWLAYATSTSLLQLLQSKHTTERDTFFFNSLNSQKIKPHDL